MAIPAYDLRDEKQAKEYLDNVSTEFRFQCYHEKSPEGCHRLADFLESVHKDFEKAARLYKTNCDDNGYGHSCYKYGNYKVLGRGCEKKMDEALQYHLKACDGGYMPSCHNAGLIYGGGKVGGKDFKKAMDFFLKACNKNYQFSCYQASALYITGKEKLPKDMKKAFKYSKMACELGNVYACVNVSQMYQKGDGVAKDEKLAEKYRLQAKEMADDITKTKKTLTFGQ